MFEIKKATDWNETEVLENLAREIWEEHYTPIIGSSQVRYMLEKYQSQHVIWTQIKEEGYIYYIAFADREPVGYCCIKLAYDKDRIFLSKIYVKKEYRQKGLASLMFNYFLAEPNAAGFTSVYLTVNKNNGQSIAAYRRIGFEITDSIVTDIGNGYMMDDYVMTYIIK